MTKVRLLLGLTALTGVLSACGSRGEEEQLAAEPSATSSSRQEDRFGSEFGKAFRADPNSEPAKVNANDMKPVSSTEEPLEVR